MPPSDPLDMRNYRIDRLPKREKTSLERWLALIAPFAAVGAFVCFGYLVRLPFLQSIDVTQLVSNSAKNAFQKLGPEAFARSNHLMLGIFVAGILLWATDAIPNYLTSLILIVALVLTKVLPEKEAYAQLGHEVMWLNIMSFVLASMLVSTGVAKRFALWFILRFGRKPSYIFLSFLVINLLLSALVSATTAKAAILLPIFMVIAAIYGARGGKNRNNFGRSIVLQNLFQNCVGAGAFMTGSAANLLAVAIISGATGEKIFYADWLVAMLPVTLVILLAGFVLATKVFFPLSPEERRPQVAGGMERLREEYRSLGPVTGREVRAVILLTAILGMWATDRFHGISATAVAFLGGIVALLPGIGIVKWNDVDIPWHLMLFSAGAYALGAGLAVTDLPSILVNAFFDHLGVREGTPYWLLYLLLTSVMLFSALLFQSKTMRAMIFVPLAIGTASRFGYPIVSLALPVAFLIEHVYVLPFNSKPALLLYETDHYSLGEAFRFGFTMLVVTWIVTLIASETWFRFLGITPHGVFGFF
ncbi:MAG: DASS family sodium-coupled anion symporter [candidate division KSB1 bacterium]|nr:DASS family sodium-coupled anion symporter [candidate division KSB1 bacterium]